MSDPTLLLSMLALTVFVYFGGMWVSEVINDRNDEIVTGVINGTPISMKYRRLMLFTKWLPYATFLVVFLIVASLGVLELARGADDDRIRIVGYACTMLMLGGAAFWSILGVFVFAHMWSVLRDSTRT